MGRNLPKITWWVSGKDRPNSGLLPLHPRTEWPPCKRPEECCTHLSNHLRDPHRIPQQPIFVYVVWAASDSITLSYILKAATRRSLYFSGLKGRRGLLITLPLEQGWALICLSHRREKWCGLKGKTRTQIPLHQLYKIIKSNHRSDVFFQTGRSFFYHL